jgi:DNA replication protein DnaC
VSAEALGGQLERIRAKAEQRANEQADRMGVAAVPAEAREAAEAGRRSALAASWAAKVPAKYREASPGDFDAGATAQLARWRDAWHDGVNLLITGPVGVGKTRAAFAAVKAPFAEGAEFDFWPEVELMNALDWRQPDHQAVLRRAMSVPVLMLDDLALAGTNDWWMKHLYAIVNRRWLDDLPTIATTNLVGEQLEEAIGERTISRLAHNAVTVRLTGDDRRSS